MRDKLKRIFSKKAKIVRTPFTITILVDPNIGQLRWVLTCFNTVPYPIIFNALEMCRDDFKKQEMIHQAQLKAKEQAKEQPKENLPQKAAPNAEEKK
jgi:hypothetical protein